MLFDILDFACCRIADALVRFASILPRRDGRDSPGRGGKKRILLVANNLLGDTLVNLPFFAALRRACPGNAYHIAIALTAPAAKAMRGLPYFDEIIESPYQHDRHALFWIFDGKTFVCPLLRWAFRHKVDVFISLLRLRSLGCDLVLRLCRPGLSIAYTHEEGARTFPMSARYQKHVYDRLYTRLLSPERGRHRLDDLAQMLAIVKGSSVAPLPRLTMEDLAPMLDFRVADALGGSAYAVLVPGAGTASRQWPVERFAELADRLGMDVAVVGSKGEAPLGEAIAGRASVKVANLCGRTSLAELGGVIARAGIVVTNETGTATYAAMLGAPTVCIVGGGDFGAFFPNPHCPNTRSVYRADGCFFCRWSCAKGSPAGGAAPCIAAVPAGDVCEAAEELLRRSARADRAPAAHQAPATR